MVWLVLLLYLPGSFDCLQFIGSVLLLPVFVGGLFTAVCCCGLLGMVVILYGVLVFRLRFMLLW